MAKKAMGTAGASGFISKQCAHTLPQLIGSQRASETFLDVVTPEEAKTVRAKWINEGSLFCHHPYPMFGPNGHRLFDRNLYLHPMRKSGGEKD